MGPSTQHFYDGMSESYHLIYEDWKRTVSSQGQFWDRWIRSRLKGPGSSKIRLLDASCGIGTQSLGLARHGFDVTATDLSPDSVARAKREAEAMGLSIQFGTADFRTLDQDVAGTFDVVFSADNAVPHLLTDEDLLNACRQFYNKCVPGGMVIITIRDYDSLIRERPRATQPIILDHENRVPGVGLVGRRIDIYNPAVYTAGSVRVLEDGELCSRVPSSSAKRAEQLFAAGWIPACGVGHARAVRFLSADRNGSQNLNAAG